MIVVQCKDCRTELSSNGRSQSCGCPNMMTVKEDSVTAVDLTRVVMVSSNRQSKTKQGVLSDNDLMFQEERRKRKVRRLDFEVR